MWSLASRPGCGQGAHFEASAQGDQGDDVWLTLFAEGLECLTSTVWEAVAPTRCWLDRVRAGVVAFLGFFDDEPEWAQVLLCDPPLSDGAQVVRCRQRLAGVLTGLLDDGGPQVLGELTSEPQLTAELVAGGVVAVVRRHMLEGEGEPLEGDSGPLVQLAPSLMSFVVRPYLGHGAAQEELAGTPPPQREGTVRTSDKRASTPGPLAAAWTASARPRGTGWSLRAALSQTSGVGGSPAGGLAHRSIGNREDKGVVEK